MKLSKYFGFFVLALTLVLANSANALVNVAYYTFTNTAQFTSIDSQTNTTAGTLTATSLPNSSRVTSGSSAYYSFNQSDLGTSINTGKYISFTVSIDSNFYMNLVGGSLTMSVASSQSGRSSSWAIRSSLDNFSSNLATGSTTSTTFSTVGISTFSGTQFDGLTNSITFRIYGWHASNGRNLYVDNIRLAANFVVAAVPEPGTCTLAAMGLVLIGGRVLRSYRHRKGSDKP